MSVDISDVEDYLGDLYGGLSSFVKSFDSILNSLDDEDFDDFDLFINILHVARLTMAKRDLIQNSLIEFSGIGDMLREKVLEKFSDNFEITDDLMPEAFNNFLNIDFADYATYGDEELEEIFESLSLDGIGFDDEGYSQNVSEFVDELRIENPDLFNDTFTYDNFVIMLGNCNDLDDLFHGMKPFQKVYDDITDEVKKACKDNILLIAGNVFMLVHTMIDDVLKNFKKTNTYYLSLDPNISFIGYDKDREVAEDVVYYVDRDGVEYLKIEDDGDIDIRYLMTIPIPNTEEHSFSTKILGLSYGDGTTISNNVMYSNTKILETNSNINRIVHDYNPSYPTSLKTFDEGFGEVKSIVSDIEESISFDYIQKEVTGIEVEFKFVCTVDVRGFYINNYDSHMNYIYKGDYVENEDAKYANIRFYTYAFYDYFYDFVNTNLYEYQTTYIRNIMSYDLENYFIELGKEGLEKDSEEYLELLKGYDYNKRVNRNVELKDYVENNYVVTHTIKIPFVRVDFNIDDKPFDVKDYNKFMYSDAYLYLCDLLEIGDRNTLQYGMPTNDGVDDILTDEDLVKDSGVIVKSSVNSINSLSKYRYSSDMSLSSSMGLSMYFYLHKEKIYELYESSFSYNKNIFTETFQKYSDTYDDFVDETTDFLSNIWGD